MTLPVANFSAVISVNQCDFTDLSLNTPTSWVWDFGDIESGVENTSTLQHPTHLFTGNGRYLVSLTATNGSGSHQVTKTVRISVSDAQYISLSTEKLTDESDDARIASSPSLVQDGNGRKVMFYSKTLVTGRISSGRVLTSAGFSISVDAGTGILNGDTKSWDADTLLAQANAFQMVYVDLTTSPQATLGITTDFSISFLKNVIPLAYLYSGSSAITRLFEIEKEGEYIYVQKQIQNLESEWVWEDSEKILSSGTSPSAFFDLTTNRIYLTYKKDDAIYQRVIEVGNEDNAWDLLFDYNILAGNQIALNQDPTSAVDIQGGASGEIPITGSFDQDYLFLAEDSLVTSSPSRVMGSASKSIQKTVDPIGFTPHILGFWPTYDGNEYIWEKYLNLPGVTILGSAPIVVQPEFFEIYTGTPETQVLVESIPYSEVFSWRSINAYSGIIYLGWRGLLGIAGSSLVSYKVPPGSRRIIYIPATKEGFSQSSDTQLNTNHLLGIRDISGSGLGKTAIVDEFYQELVFQAEDTLLQNEALMGSASKGILQVITV